CTARTTDIPAPGRTRRRAAASGRRPRHMSPALAILLDRPIAAGRRAPPGARKRHDDRWDGAHHRWGARIGTQGACQCTRRDGAKSENAVFGPHRMTCIGGFPSKPGGGSATFGHVIGRLQTLANAGSCRRQRAGSRLPQARKPAVRGRPNVSEANGAWSMSRCRSAFSAIVTALVLAAPAARAQNLPRLNTNQAYVEEAARTSSLDVKDPMAVLGFVLDSLPERVKVYPTENYYYFSFLHNGVPYAGNTRLDASTRDDGKVSFGYYEDYPKWKAEVPVTFRLLDAADGVRLEKLDRFAYRLSYRQKAVVFELNDLTQAKPSRLGSDETFVGPIFDESGVRFFLIYNARLKIFHYVLDESAPAADALFAVEGRDRILIGKRTGFAFYRDHRLDRKILIGVYLRNAELNTYFDGPFDQLPDNFVEGETLREALVAVDPSLKGKIDRFGAWPGGEERYMIAPYVMYEKASDL